MKISAQTQMLAMLAPAQAVLVMLVSTLVAAYLQTQFESHLRRNLSQAAQIAGNAVHQHLRNRGHQNALIASRTQLRLSLNELLDDATQQGILASGIATEHPARRKIWRILADARRSVPDIVGLYLLAPDGSEVALASGSPRLPPEALATPDSGGPRQLRLHTLEGGGLIELRVAELLLDGEHVGNLLAAYRVDNLLIQLRNSARIPGASGTVELLAVDGRGAPRQLLATSPAGGHGADRDAAEISRLRVRQPVADTDMEVSVSISSGEQSAFRGRLLWVVLPLLLTAIAVMALLTAFGLQRMMQPLRQLSDWAGTRLSGGGAPPPPDSRPYREVEVLAHSLEQLLSESDNQQLQLRSLVYSLPSGVLAVDRRGCIRLFNHHCELLFGYHESELLGRSVETLVPQPSVAEHRELREGFDSAEDTHTMGVGRDVRGRRKDGSTFDAEIALTPVQAGGNTWMLATVTDASARKERERQLQLSAETDELTGLHNRRYLRRRLAEEWRRAMREGSVLGAMMIDIDHFKRFNDAAGHEAGDRCLVQVAGVIAEHCRREGEFCARYGGEEFFAVAAGRNLDDMLALGELLRAAVSAEHIPHPGTGGEVSLSIGVAAWSISQTDHPDDLIRAADRSLYRAKKAGRNRVCS